MFMPAVSADQMENAVETGEETNNIDIPLPVEAAAGGKLTKEKLLRTSRERMYPVHVHLFYENRYVTEGRDNLSGNGLLSASSDILLGSNISFVPWLAYSRQSDYTELDLNIAASFDFDETVEVYVLFDHIRTTTGSLESNDNQIEVAAIFSAGIALDVYVDAYYSFDADHGFAETGMQNEYSFSPDASINASAVLGYNAGYVREGHRGLNYFQLKTELSLFLMERMEITAYAGYNFAIDSDPVRYADDVGLRDFMWAGAGFSYYLD